MVTFNGFVDQLCNEIKHFLGSRIRTDKIIDAFDFQRFSNLLQNFELTSAFEADAQDAQIRTAKVKSQIFTSFPATRQAKIRLEHAQRRLGWGLQSFTQVVQDGRKRFSSFNASTQEQYKTCINNYIKTILPVWMQYRNTYINF